GALKGAAQGNIEGRKLASVTFAGVRIGGNARVGEKHVGEGLYPDRHLARQGKGSRPENTPGGRGLRGAYRNRTARHNRGGGSRRCFLTRRISGAKNSEHHGRQPQSYFNRGRLT